MFSDFSTYLSQSRHVHSGPRSVHICFFPLFWIALLQQFGQSGIFHYVLASLLLCCCSKKKGLVATVVCYFLNDALNPLTKKCLLDGLDHIISVVVENK